MGFDLSAHHDLLRAQGFDIPRLSAIATWERADVQEVLSRSLRADAARAAGMKGMKGLEVLALEFAIREVGTAG